MNKESLNQPIYHLNSSNAEKILANAFENEILNSYRIKDGLTPLSPNELEVNLFILKKIIMIKFYLSLWLG